MTAILKCFGSGGRGYLIAVAAVWIAIIATSVVLGGDVAHIPQQETVQ